jgi:hypothetical protein
VLHGNGMIIVVNEIDILMIFLMILILDIFDITNVLI